ncbi:MAG: low molecular weight protein tyrosine phosphatase family protein, partial [Trichodesmium sp. MAG_R04]|nr:low molecular weight protein tyrosine phosphatase family protein [Trichodesmium sp. MAG_R04]
DCSNVAINFSDDSFCVMGLILQHYLYFFSSYPNLLSGYKLYICSQNRLRSPAAETIFSEYPDLEVDSAGLSRGAEIPLCSEVVQWADIIFVMEKSHQRKLSNKFQPWLKNKRVICLDIRDEYEYMQPELVELLKKKVLPLLK